MAKDPKRHRIHQPGVTVIDCGERRLIAARDPAHESGVAIVRAGIGASTLQSSAVLHFQYADESLAGFTPAAAGKNLAGRPVPPSPAQRGLRRGPTGCRSPPED